MKHFPLFLATLFFGLSVSAQDAGTDGTEVSPLTHESELSLVTVDGNSSSESYSAKQKTEYKIGPHAFSVTGRYLRTISNHIETARAWNAAARYEYAFTEFLGAFISHGAESDPYNGYVQRDNTDIGGKHFLIKSEPENLYYEAGYRYTKEQTSVGTITYSGYGRLYTEYNRQIDRTVSLKFWVEYLPNFTTSQAYLLNGEPSINVMLSRVFSLKTAYLMKYRNQVNPGEKYTDKTFTTSLVARF
ncbi:MAG: DUF481 domain-containing protein [Bdellovibrionaceae bacterium]|nr:DUF481 domain-containing protein [Pseudobdellovibrionaceae bacterium]MBX3032989.1 DUF481 domain-containing protein [Pseudobdellovibrionaceae bacterium]